MRSVFFASIAMSMVVSLHTVAADEATDDPRYLNRVESPVFETSGNHQAISKHAATCIAQIIKPGLVNAPTIVSSDFDAGIVVANNTFKFSLHGFLGSAIEDKGRTTLTFQAKDGRFKIVHTNIEEFLEYPGQFASMSQGWSRVYAEASGAADMKNAVDLISQELANCVKADPAKDGDW